MAKPKPTPWYIWVIVALLVGGAAAGASGAKVDFGSSGGGSSGGGGSGPPAGVNGIPPGVSCTYTPFNTVHAICDGVQYDLVGGTWQRAG
jgi:hypothetical protein